MISVLLVMISVTVLFQPNAPRFFAAVMFVSVTLAHEFFMSDLDGFFYYGSAALFDLAIIILTAGINPVPQMVIDLHKICLASVLLNGVGWVMWQSYMPPAFYNLSFMALYVWTFIVLTERNPADVGGYKLDRWMSCFHFSNFSCLGYSFKHGRTP